MAHTPVTIAAVDVARLTLCNALDNKAMRDAKPVTRDLVWQILVADHAFFRILGAHVGDEPLVGCLFVRRPAISPVAGQAAQLAVGSHHRLRFYEVFLGPIWLDGAAL